MSTRSFPRWASTPTVRPTRSRISALSATLASRFSSSRWIRSTLTTGAESRTSGSLIPSSLETYSRYSRSAAVISPRTFCAKRYFSGFWEAERPLAVDRLATLLLAAFEPFAEFRERLDDEVRRFGSSRALEPLPSPNPGPSSWSDGWSTSAPLCLSSALTVLSGRHRSSPGRLRGCPALDRRPVRPGRLRGPHPVRPGLPPLAGALAGPHALSGALPEVAETLACALPDLLHGLIGALADLWQTPPRPPDRRPRRRRRRSRTAPRYRRRCPPRRGRSRRVAPGCGPGSARPCRGSSERCRVALSAQPEPRLPRSPASPCRGAHARRHSDSAACGPWPGLQPVRPGRLLRLRRCRP